MAERNSGWVSGELVNAEDARLATGALITSDGGPIRSRSGLKPATGSPGLVQPTSPTASASVTIQPFQAVIQGGRRAAAGSYLATLDEVKTINVLADGNRARQDLIVAVQTDAEYGDQRSALEIRRIPGDPDRPTVDPTVAGDHLPLARVTVPAGATAITAANIADLRTFTTASGGILPVANKGSRPASPYPGQAVYATAEGATEVFDGSGWRPIARGGMATYGPADVNFPQNGPTTGNTSFLINRVTVPAVGFARSLFITAQVTFSATNHAGAFDVNLKTDSTRWIPAPWPRAEPRAAADPIPVPALQQNLSTIVVQPLPNDTFFTASLSAVVEQSPTRARVIDTVVTRMRGSGQISNLGTPYTLTNILAIPV